MDSFESCWGLHEIIPHKSALDLETNRVPCSSFKAQVDSKLARGNWGPTDFNYPQFHSCTVQGKSYLTGLLDLWHRRMRQVSKEPLKRVHSHGLVDGFNIELRITVQFGSL